jgi:hypothetical protein
VISFALFERQISLLGLIRFIHCHMNKLNLRVSLSPQALVASRTMWSGLLFLFSICIYMDHQLLIASGEWNTNDQEHKQAIIQRNNHNGSNNDDNDLIV